MFFAMNSTKIVFLRRDYICQVLLTLRARTSFYWSLLILDKMSLVIVREIAY